MGEQMTLLLTLSCLVAGSLTHVIQTPMAALEKFTYHTQDQAPPALPLWPEFKYTPAEEDIEILTCSAPTDWAFTYDDGPSESTSLLLDYFDETKEKATFFILGSRVFGSPKATANLKRAYAAGHQIALHTWSHSNLLTTSPSDEVVFAEIIWNMRAVKEVIGVVPKYFRAPYGALSPKIRGLLTSLGLKIVFWNLDSEDSLPIAKKSKTHVEEMITAGANDMKQGEFPKGIVSLEHDLHPWQVGYALEAIKSAKSIGGFTLKTVADCVGDSNPYLNEIPDSAANVLLNKQPKSIVKSDDDKKLVEKSDGDKLVEKSDDKKGSSNSGFRVQISSFSLLLASLLFVL